MTFDLDADALKVYKKRYRAKIRETAAAVRRIFVILAERKLLESTIVIVSRWGSSMITHSFGKLDDREATHRVPLLLWFPATYGFKSCCYAYRLDVTDRPVTHAERAVTRSEAEKRLRSLWYIH